MEQDIVNNLKSRVQKLEEELLKVVSTCASLSFGAVILSRKGFYSFT